MGREKTIEYPEWVEQYRGKGVTIRKVKDGYGLYRCTTKTENSSRRCIQEYLGMVTEKDGFIPKRTAPPLQLLEYGLSHVIWRNYGADLKRRAYSGGENLAKLGVILFIKGSLDGESIRSSYLTYKDAAQLEELAGKVQRERIERLADFIEESLHKRIPDKWQYRSFISGLLLLPAVIMTGTIKKYDPSEVLLEELKRYGLKF